MFVVSVSSFAVPAAELIVSRGVIKSKMLEIKVKIFIISIAGNRWAQFLDRLIVN
ncbi:MAG: hypothetical protein JXI43_09645 [Tissierellales bacterium]|nr:hypothetical protein [Tissierellales bacterium]